MEYALKDDRIVVTRYTDIGSVLQYPNHPGAIILRLLSKHTAKRSNDVLKEFLSPVEGQILQEAITIVEIGRYRRRSLKYWT